VLQARHVRKLGLPVNPSTGINASDYRLLETKIQISRDSVSDQIVFATGL
jgi:hypothetical protein